MARSSVELPSGSFAFEPKYDGWRLCAHGGRARGGARLHTRSGADATSRFPEIVEAVTAFGDVVLDGELVSPEVIAGYSVPHGEEPAHQTADHLTRNGNVSSIAPLSCPFGHVLARGRVLVGWYPCACSGARHCGHHTWSCRTCLDLGRDPATFVVFEGFHDPTDPGAGAQQGPNLQHH